MAAPDREVLASAVAALGLDAEDVHDQRAGLDAAAAATPLPAGVAVEAATLAGLPAERVVATGRSPRGAVLVCHGGGYCVGSLAAERYLAARLALAVDAEIWTFAYRLAPEHPFPAAHDDAVRAWAAFPGAAGRGAGATAILGESAGGGLAVAAMVAARDAGAPLPAAAVCVSPWLDLTLAQPSSNDGRDLVITSAATRRWRDWYLGSAAPEDPRASPLLADLSGLPPLLVQAGGDDLLLDDARRVADAARAAGVDVTLSVADGNSHVAAVYPPELVPDSTACIAEIARFLDTRLSA